MCPKEDVDYQNLELQELKSGLDDLKSDVADVCKHINVREELHRQEVKSELEYSLADVRSDLAEVKSKMAEVNRSLEEKLDAVLAKLH